MDAAMQPAQDSYHLQWKGKVTGPFTLQEIRAMLDSNEIGLLHTVRPCGATRW